MVIIYNRSQPIIMWLILWLPVLWLAALLAQCYQPMMNVLDLVASLNYALTNPIQLSWTEQTPRFMLLFSIIYLFGIGMYYATRLNRRPKEEHGCATQVKVLRLVLELFDYQIYVFKPITLCKF